MRGLALGRRAARVGARGVGTTTRASQAESQTATSEQQGEQSQQGGLQRQQEQKRALARSPLSSMMITTLHTVDGYDIDDESSLDDLFGSYSDVLMEVKAEVDLQAQLVEAEEFCCGFC